MKKLFNTVLKALAEEVLVTDVVEASVAEERLQVCQDCDQLNREEMRCKVCTCFVEVKVKAYKNRNGLKGGRTELTHCPLGKWNDAQIANMYRKIDGLEPLEL